MHVPLQYTRTKKMEAIVDERCSQVCDLDLVLSSVLVTVDAEEERMLMSNHLTQSVGYYHLDKALEEVESSSRVQSTVTAIVGPFGSFHVSVLSSRPNSDESATPLVVSPSSQQDSEDQRAITSSSPLIAPDGWAQGTSNNDTFEDSSLTWDLTDNGTASFTAPVLTSLLEMDGLGSGNWGMGFPTNLLQDVSICQSPRSLQVRGSIMDCGPIPENMHFLLDHYKNQAETSFSPLRVRKPPWSVLHLPSALSAFSELTLFKETSNAKAALLYAVLAVSAFHLDKVVASAGSSNYWWTVGEELRDRAKAQLQSCSYNELVGPGRSKYKEILMAILTMVTICVVNGQQNEARSYLLNAELLICTRGVTKQFKSRKVRMLHYIYLFLRVMEESTYIYPRTWRPLVTPDYTPLMRFPSIRTYSVGQGTDLDTISAGNFEIGLIGESCEAQTSETLFEKIYGIPEAILSLISQTTSLANEILVLGGDEACLPSDLARRSKVLENEICSWVPASVSDYEPNNNAIPENRTIMPHLILGIHCSLVIYFYRRIRNIAPLLLQSYVQRTIEHLESNEQAKLDSSVINTGIVWPGFIAATEAISHELQERCERWLRECARQSGMRNFDTAADVAREVWKARKESGDMGVSWVTLIRDRRVALILT
ncbi:hypothetical protein V502_07701 [Pseudogymnoascus sp. VKM F-4520 (FW-2644)]|nr:hypothetical protein V502_07701 [Pseudogymnoascus sp. VKM F-4520 (FW-2644)]